MDSFAAIRPTEDHLLSRHTIIVRALHSRKHPVTLGIEMTSREMLLPGLVAA